MKQLLIYILPIVMFSNLTAQNEITKIEDLGEIHTIEFENTVNDFFKGKDLVKKGSYYYILNRKSSNVEVYNLDGKFINKIGSSGKGPGEFLFPTSILVDEGRIMVAEFNGQIEIFSLDGIHLETLNVPIMPLSSFKTINYEHILLEGKHYKDEAINLLHIYSLKENKIIKSFFPMPLQNNKYSNIFYILGELIQSIIFEEFIYCFFTPLNELYVYDIKGNMVSKTKIELDYFKRIKENTRVSSKKMEMEYLKSFSKITSIYRISKEQLIIQYIKYKRLIPGIPINIDDYVLSLAIINFNGDVLYELDNTSKILFTEASESYNTLFFTDNDESNLSETITKIKTNKL